MIVHETAIRQMTVEYKLLLVPLRPSIINQSPHHKQSCSFTVVGITALYTNGLVTLQKLIWINLGICGLGHIAFTHVLI